jgi:hypothetical protein
MNTKFTSLLLAAVGICLLDTPVWAWPGDGCKFKAERRAEVSTAGAKSIEILAGAGDLQVRGQPGAAKVIAGGKACAPSQALLDQTTVVVVREGDVVKVSTQIPPAPAAGVSNLWGATNPYIDLDVDLPTDIPVRLVDSSGDTSVRHIAGGSIRDSSGDLEVDEVGGDLEVLDSSGDLHVSDVRGKLTLEDSSGDIKLRNIRGDVQIKVDSSGDIRIVDAGANVAIDSDGSGDVDVEGVAGDFILGSKGSGDVNVHGVRGRVSIPENKKD